MSNTFVRPVVSLGMMLAILLFALSATRSSWSTSPNIQVGRGGARTNWAVVNDSASMKTTLTLAITMLITKGKVSYYPDCETAIAGPIHQVYLVDNDMGGGMMGPACVTALRAKAPSALIIGLTQSSEVKDKFFQAGADAFDSSIGDPIGVIKSILSLK